MPIWRQAHHAKTAALFAASKGMHVGVLDLDVFWMRIVQTWTGLTGRSTAIAFGNLRFSVVRGSFVSNF